MQLIGEIKQFIGAFLMISLFSMNTPVVHNSFSSVSYAKTKVNVTKVISNLVSDLKKVTTQEEKKATIAMYSTILGNASKREIESALRKNDPKLFISYKKAARELSGKGEQEAAQAINSLIFATANDSGASWAGCTVAWVGAVLIGVGIILAIVALTKKTNEKKIREDARQDRAAQLRAYEDELYFLNNAVSITEDRVDNLETNIAQAEVDLATLNGKIDVLTELIIEDSDSSDIDALKAQREALLHDRDSLSIDISEMYEDLQGLNNSLNYYLIEENIEFELTQAKTDYDAAVIRITNNEEAEVSLIPETKKDKKNLFIAAGISGALGTIGATSFGDCDFSY